MLKHIFLILVIFLSYFLWNQRPVKHGVGITAPNEPSVVKVVRHGGFELNHYKLYPTWKIETTARVLSKKRYWFDDKTQISQNDLVIGWNNLSDERILNQVKIPITDRDFRIDVIQPPLTFSEIRNQIMFMHTVPANDAVKEKLNSLRNGHIIRMKGYIVDVNDHSSIIWKSSFSDRNNRLDSNQIVYIEDIEII